MIKYLEGILKNITSEQIALISVIVTILLYLLGKHNELKFKKHELKKEKYMQFLDLLKDAYLKGGEIFSKEAYKTKFFDFGSTVFIYGSKKMYKKYCFFREISSDFIKKMKYYDSELVLYLVSDLLNQIRREIGMYDFEIPLEFKSIAFFTNDIFFNPNIRLKWWKNKFKVFLIKFELFMIKIENLTFLKLLLNLIIVPFQMISILFKYLFIIPLGRLLIKLGLQDKLCISDENNFKVKKGGK